MRFGYTILYVRDVAASVDLYERAFGQRRRFLHESGEYAELETGSTTLSLASHELAASNLPGAFRRPTGRRRPPSRSASSPRTWPGHTSGPCGRARSR